MNTTTIQKAPTVMHLAQVWMLVQETPLQPKEFGQLKCLRDRCGPHTEHLIEWALHGWPEFTDTVKHETGFDNVPPLPRIGFLLKFYEIAIIMMADARPEHVAHAPTKTDVSRSDAE